MSDRIIYLASDFTYDGLSHLEMHNSYVLAYKSNEIFAFSFDKTTNEYAYITKTTGGTPCSNGTYIVSFIDNIVYIHSFNGTAFTTEATISFALGEYSDGLSGASIDSNNYIYVGRQDYPDYVDYVNCYTFSSGTATYRGRTDPISRANMGEGGIRSWCVNNGTIFVVKKFGETYPSIGKCDSIRVYTFNGSTVTYQTYYQPPYAGDNGPTDYGYSRAGGPWIRTDGTYVVYSYSLKWYGNSPYGDDDRWYVLAQIFSYTGGTLSLVDELLQRQDGTDLWAPSVSNFSITSNFSGKRLIYRSGQKFLNDHYPLLIQESGGVLSEYNTEEAVYWTPNVTLPDNIGNTVAFDNDIIHGIAHMQAPTGVDRRDWLSAYYVGPTVDISVSPTATSASVGVQSPNVLEGAGVVAYPSQVDIHSTGYGTPTFVSTSASEASITTLSHTVSSVNLPNLSNVQSKVRPMDVIVRTN